jgi:hypothetical protein
MRLIACLLAIVILGHSTDVGAQPAERARELSLTAIPPQAPVQILGNAWRINAIGPIDTEAPERLRRLIINHNIPDGSTIFFNSPGGNVIAAMELGRVLRDFGLFSEVGTFGSHASPQQQNAGICLSACALAFIGGKFRFHRNNTLFGVHRFYSVESQLGDDITQILSSMIIQYIREMGVDTRLFSELVRVGRSEINILDIDKLESLGVINHGIGPTAWSIESRSDIIYVKGERDTRRGINKFILTCDGPNFLLIVIFDAQGRWPEIEMMHAHSLLVDGRDIPFDPSSGFSMSFDNGWVTIGRSIPRDNVDLIQQARTVGYAVQLVYGSPIFLGFDGMDATGARERLPGFRRFCR